MDQINLYQTIIEFVEKKQPICRRVDIVNNFTVKYSLSVPHIYNRIRKLIENNIIIKTGPFLVINLDEFKKAKLSNNQQ